MNLTTMFKTFTTDLANFQRFFNSLKTRSSRLEPYFF